MVYNILSCQIYAPYIQNGMNLEHVAALEDSWMKNILEMVPPHLQSLNTTLQLLDDEIKEDYLHSVKTAICIYLITLKIIKFLAFDLCNLYTIIRIIIIQDSN